MCRSCSYKNNSRNAEKDPKSASTVKIVTTNEPCHPKCPVGLVIGGSLQFLGYFSLVWSIEGGCKDTYGRFFIGANYCA